MKNEGNTGSFYLLFQILPCFLRNKNSLLIGRGTWRLQRHWPRSLLSRAVHAQVFCYSLNCTHTSQTLPCTCSVLKKTGFQKYVVLEHKGRIHEFFPGDQVSSQANHINEGLYYYRVLSKPSFPMRERGLERCRENLANQGLLSVHRDTSLSASEGKKGEQVLML